MYFNIVWIRLFSSQYETCTCLSVLFSSQYETCTCLSVLFPSQYETCTCLSVLFSSQYETCTCLSVLFSSQYETCTSFCLCTKLSVCRSVWPTLPWNGTFIMYIPVMASMWRLSFPNKFTDVCVYVSIHLD